MRDVKVQISPKMLYQMMIILFIMIFACIHELVFFTFLSVKNGFLEAIKINMSLKKWWNFISSPNMEYLLLCILMPIVLSFILTFYLYHHVSKKL